MSLYFFINLDDLDKKSRNEKSPSKDAKNEYWNQMTSSELEKNVRNPFSDFVNWEANFVFRAWWAKWETFGNCNVPEMSLSQLGLKYMITVMPVIFFYFSFRT